MTATTLHRDNLRATARDHKLTLRAQTAAELMTAWVVSIDDRRIVRWDAYWDPDEAKRALGLSE